MLCRLVGLPDTKCKVNTILRNVWNCSHYNRASHPGMVESSFSTNFFVTLREKIFKPV